MKVILNNIEYWVYWQYCENTSGKFTLCNIETRGFNLFATGTTKLSPKDKFVKEVGRKTSLERALKQVFPEKADREVFWKAYLNRKPSNHDKAIGYRP